MRLKNIQKGRVITLQHNSLWWFPLQPTLRERVWSPSPSFSYLQPLWKWDILRGAGRLHGLHYVPCSSLLSQQILTLLQALMPPLTEICNRQGSFSIAIPPLLMLSVTLTNLPLLVFILISNKLDKYLFNLSEIHLSGKSLKINQRYPNIYMFISTYFTAAHLWALENSTFI